MILMLIIWLPRDQVKISLKYKVLVYILNRLFESSRSLHACFIITIELKEDMKQSFKYDTFLKNIIFWMFMHVMRVSLHGYQWYSADELTISYSILIRYMWKTFNSFWNVSDVTTKEYQHCCKADIEIWRMDDAPGSAGCVIIHTNAILMIYPTTQTPGARFNILQPPAYARQPCCPMKLP